MSVYIIAEIGPNHNGSFEKAIKIVDEIKKTGANAVKFQMANPEKVYSKDSFKANYQIKNDGKRSIIQMSKANQLSKEQHLKLSKYCKKKKLEYLCTAFDIDSLKFLIEKIKVKFVKIASGEVFDLEALNYLSKINKTIFLSTGLATEKNLFNSLKILNKNFKKKIILMHCISNYPANPSSINMRYLLKLKSIFKCDIGYSDHSLSPNSSIVAVSLGAKVIEKHVTLNKKNLGPDHKISSSIKEFNELVKNIREVEIILGKSRKFFTKETNEISRVARKSIVSKNFIKKGMRILKKDLQFKRPGTGISPFDINKIIGKLSVRDIKPDHVVKYSDIANFTTK